MEKVTFNPSVKPTVGIEIEAQLVDKTSGNLVNIAEDIVNEYSDEERVKHEFYLSTVEVTSSPALDINDTYKELSAILSKVLKIAEKEGAGLISSGAHPFALYEDQIVTQVNPRYQEFADTLFIDRADSHQRKDIESLGFKVFESDLIMNNLESKIALAKSVINYLEKN